MKVVTLHDVIFDIERAKPGRRRFGVPVRGPLDSASFESAIWSVDAERAIECHGYGGAEFEAEQDCYVAIAGDRGREHTFLLHAGERFNLPIGTPGTVTYVAAGLEPQARKLSKFDAGDQELRVIEVDPLFVKHLLKMPLEVGMRSDRKGRILHGLSLGASGLPKSRPTVVGAVQLTPSGDVIILGPDGPTIGGYAHIATVVREDLHKIGRAGIGHKISFNS